MKKLLLPLLLLSFSYLAADDGDDKKKPDGKSFADVVENCDLIDGLFNLYQDRDDGTVYIAIKNEQIDQEYIHFAYVLNGIPELGLFRGNFLHEQIFTVRRHFDKIEFVSENTSFYFDPESALSKAADANISDAVLASQKIEATTEDKTTHLIKADNIFLKEFFSMVKPASREKDKDKLVLGDLSGDRTRFTEIKNYPENSLLRVNYVYENARPKEWGEDDVTDARYITISVQHALIKVPENDYRPRLEDPRVGFFTTRQTDLTSAKSANFRDLLNRWHLKKKDPKAEKSDPVEPITWWIENTTPVELRDTIKTAVEAWNLAFESAGFTNAVVCKIQHDDAEWDAGDIRYNVLRWTSSPDPPFGGYGPSFANPRTGQLLGADIMLEYVFMTNRIRLRELLQKSDGEPVDETSRFSEFLHQRNHNSRCTACFAANHMQQNAIAARASLAVAGASKIEMDALLKEALTDLVLHEIGHTLGLNHNFIASTLYSPEEIHDKKLTSKTGIIASVMDYAPSNIASDREKQGHYYSVVPGPYDHWAIRFGYTETTPETEEKLIGAILAESTKPEHAFGNDADDMRSAGRGIDPRIMINDLTNDPIAHAIATVERVQKTMDGLLEKFPTEGEGYHELRTAFTSLMREYDRATTTLTRYVGGVKIDRSVHGQPGASEAPFIPVEAEKQKAALDALQKYLFGPEAFDFFPSKLIASLQLKRRGFSHFDLDANEDPKIHSAVAGMQKGALNQLLHKNTLQRLVDSGLYGNEVTVADAMTLLSSAVMDGETNTFREAIQLDFVKRLITISGLKSDSAYPAQAQSQAVFLLEEQLEKINAADRNAHNAHLKRLITNALEGR